MKKTKNIPLIIRQIFMIIIALIILSFGVYNLIEASYFKAAIKIVIGIFFLIIFTDKNSFKDNTI